MLEITKNQLKLIRSLNQKKKRKETGLFVVEGVKNIEELLKSNITVEALYATADWEGDYDDVIRITNKQLTQLSNLASPNQVLALAKIPSSKALVNDGLVLVLDNVNDPGNLGTIIRTADWFGVKQIICSPSTVDCYNPKTVQSTKGSVFNMDIIYTDLVEYLSAYKNEVYAATLDGDEQYEINKGLNQVLVMGSESHGLSPELEQFITKKIKIAKKGNAESLNVGIATGILLHQFTN